MQNKRLEKKPPNPREFSLDFFFPQAYYLSIIFILNYCVFFSSLCRFATDSYSDKCI